MKEELDDLWFDSDESEEDFSKFFTTYKTDVKVKEKSIKTKKKEKEKNPLEVDSNDILFSNARAIFSISENNIDFTNHFEDDDSIDGEISPLNYSPELNSNQNKPSTPTQVSNTNNPTIDNIINMARQYVGGKYISGGHKPSNGGFDCSGLLYYVFNQNGIKLPRATYDIFEYGEKVNSLSEVKPGDIICTPGKGYTKKHVKMVSKIENGQIYTIEAKGKKYGIVESPLKKTNNIITIRRIVSDKVKSSKKGGKLILKAKSGYKINNFIQGLNGLQNNYMTGYFNHPLTRGMAIDQNSKNPIILALKNNLIGNPVDYLTDFGKISYTDYLKDYKYLLDVNEL